jgi:hypothetical protein
VPPPIITTRWTPEEGLDWSSEKRVRFRGVFMGLVALVVVVVEEEVDEEDEKETEEELDEEEEEGGDDITKNFLSNQTNNQGFGIIVSIATSLHTKEMNW